MDVESAVVGFLNDMYNIFARFSYILCFESPDFLLFFASLSCVLLRLPQSQLVTRKTKNGLCIPVSISFLKIRQTQCQTHTITFGIQFCTKIKITSVRFIYLCEKMMKVNRFVYYSLLHSACHTSDRSEMWHT